MVGASCLFAFTELRINCAEETGEHFHGLGLCTFKAWTILLECDTDLEMCLHKQIAQWIFIPRALPVQTPGPCALGRGVRLSDMRDGTWQLPRGRVGHKSDGPLVLVLLEDDGFCWGEKLSEKNACLEFWKGKKNKMYKCRKRYAIFYRNSGISVICVQLPPVRSENHLKCHK